MSNHFLFPVNITYRVMVLAESREDAVSVAETKLSDIQAYETPEFFSEHVVYVLNGPDTEWEYALPWSRDGVNEEQKSCRHFTIDYLETAKETEKKRQQALSKLTEEEKEILGLV